MEKTTDDLKLEIAIVVDEQSMLQAQRLAMDYFPLIACNIVKAVKLVIAIYEEIFEEPYPKKDTYANILK